MLSDPAELASFEALIIAVGDARLEATVELLEPHVHHGLIVFHTCLSRGVQVLDPLETRGCVVAALAPFALMRWAVTTLDELGETVVELNITEFRGEAVALSDAERPSFAARAYYAEMLRRLHISAAVDARFFPLQRKSPWWVRTWTPKKSSPPIAAPPTRPAPQLRGGRPPPRRGRRPRGAGNVGPTRGEPMSLELGNATVISEIERIRMVGSAFHKTGRPVAFVPLTNGVHAGHIALVRAAKHIRGAVTVVALQSPHEEDLNSCAPRAWTSSGITRQSPWPHGRRIAVAPADAASALEPDLSEDLAVPCAHPDAFAYRRPPRRKGLRAPPRHPPRGSGLPPGCPRAGRARRTHARWRGDEPAQY